MLLSLRRVCGDAAATASWACVELNGVLRGTKGHSRRPNGLNEMKCRDCATRQGVNPSMLCVGC